MINHWKKLLKINLFKLICLGFWKPVKKIYLCANANSKIFKFAYFVQQDFFNAYPKIKKNCVVVCCLYVGM